MTAAVTIQETARQAACLSRGKFGFAFVDVARLGLINRHFGRTAGSRVLETIEAVLVGAPSTERIACRLWGDQFFTALPDVGSVARRMRALDRTLRRELTRVGLPTLRHPIHIGAARAGAGTPIREVIDMAADNLNTGKREGVWLIASDYSDHRSGVFSAFPPPRSPGST